MADDHAGLVKTVLGKEWDGNPIGSSVWTDPLRAAWLQENGLEAKPGEATDAPPAGTRRRTRREPPADAIPEVPHEPMEEKEKE